LPELEQEATSSKTTSTDLDPRRRGRLRRFGTALLTAETPIVALGGDGTGRLRQVRLDNGETLDRDALFFYVGWRLRNDVARTLGCELRDDGSIAVDSDQATTIDRVYAAGNCSEPRALVPAAAGTGATAAVAINARLSFEDADSAVVRSLDGRPQPLRLQPAALLGSVESSCEHRVELRQGFVLLGPIWRSRGLRC